MIALKQIKIDYARCTTSLGSNGATSEKDSRVANRRVEANPESEFGKRMLNLRRAIEDSGVKMLSLEEVLNEAKERRGGSD